MSEFTPPLRRITGRVGNDEFLECGHTQHRRANRAVRRRCIQCRRKNVTVTQRAEAADGQRCPFCFDGFDTPGEETWMCSKCSVKLHAECHEEQGSCTTLGCAGRQSVTVRALPTAPLPVTSVERIEDRRDANDRAEGGGAWRDNPHFWGAVGIGLFLGAIGISILAGIYLNIVFGVLVWWISMSAVKRYLRLDNHGF